MVPLQAVVPLAVSLSVISPISQAPPAAVLPSAHPASLTTSYVLPAATLLPLVFPAPVDLPPILLIASLVHSVMFPWPHRLPAALAALLSSAVFLKFRHLTLVRLDKTHSTSLARPGFHHRRSK